MKTTTSNKDLLKKSASSRNIKKRIKDSIIPDHSPNVKMNLSFWNNNMNLYKTRGVTQMPLDQENVNCDTPFKYDNKKQTVNNTKKITSKGVNSLKLALDNVRNPETSDDGLKGDEEEILLKKCVDESLKGRDDYGCPYMLSNINNPKYDHVLSEKDCQILDPPWLHIHACKKCLETFTSEYDINSKSMFGFNDKMVKPLSNFDEFSKNCFPLPCRSTYCYNLSTSSDYDNQQIINKNSQRNDEETHQKVKCSDQYFRRIVYSYNSCGLHYEFPNESKETFYTEKKKKMEEPKLNPYMKIVVYGTDPCGLNFPVELEDPDKVESNSDYSVVSSVNSIPKSFYRIGDSSSSNKSVADSSSNTSSLSSTNNYIKSNLSFRESNSTRVTTSNYYSQTESSNETPYRSSKSCRLSSLSSNFTYLEGNMYDDISGSTQSSSTENVPNPYCSNKSLSDSNFFDSELVPVLSRETFSTEKSVSGISSSELNISPVKSSELSKSSHSPCCGKLVEFSVYDCKPLSLKHNASVCYRSCKYIKKKKIRIPIRYGIPRLSDTKPQVIYNTSGSSSILEESSLTNNHEIISLVTMRIKLPFFLKACLYVFFFMFFVTALVLVEDSVELAATQSVLKTKREYRIFPIF